MALNWSFNEKAGTATIDSMGKEIAYNLYVGNAYLIMVREWQENGKNLYTVGNFFLDKAHMKNYLGLNKKGGYTENYLNQSYSRLKRIRLNRRYCKKANEISSLLLKAFDNITIEIYED